MSLLGAGRRILTRFPDADVQFRRRIWSRVHYPEHEMRILDQLAGRPFDVSVDVGAALGAYAWILARKSARVIAFEPGTVHGAFIERGIRGTNIELVRAAVGAEDGEAEMFTPGTDKEALHSATLNAANPVVASSDLEVTRVPQIALDSFLPDRIGNRRLDMLKVDVEGYESAVFDGAKSRIAKDYPLILCEIEARHNVGYLGVFDLLRNMGYVAHYLVGDRFMRFDGTEIASMQSAEALADRLSPHHRPEANAYINNFIFEHPASKVQITEANQ